MAVDVSIVVAIYNAEEYINNCLDMLTRQTLKNIEIICVDDGSVDESLKMLQAYSSRDERIRVFTEENKGAGAARNRGLTEATGKYMLFLDCDDFFEPDMVQLAYEKAEEQGAEIVIYKSDQYNMGSGEFVYENWAMMEWALPPYEPFGYRQISTNIFKAFVGWAWDKLYLREFVAKNDLKFQEQRTTNDALFVFSALVLAEKISTVRKILIHRRVDTADSLSKTREKSWITSTGCCLPSDSSLRTEKSGMNLRRILSIMHYIFHSGITIHWLSLQKQNSEINWCQSGLRSWV